MFKPKANGNNRLKKRLSLMSDDASVDMLEGIAILPKPSFKTCSRAKKFMEEPTQ